MSLRGSLLLIPLVALGLLIPVAALEITVRLGALTPAARANDRPSRYYLPLHSGNERDYPHQAAKAPGVYRIVFVGDSFTFGDYLQFDDTYSKRLERWLNLNGGPQKVEIINFSKPGFSTFDELMLVRSAVTSLSPDLILLQFTLNDPEMKPFRDAHRDEVNQSFLRAAVTKYWKGLNFLLNRYDAWKSRATFKEYYFNLFEQPETWNRCSDAIAKMKSMADGRSIKFGAVIFPLFDYPMDERYPFLPLHKKVQEKFSALQIPWLDLFEAYKGMTPERLQVIPGENAHPNEIANRIAAEKIYSWLFKQEYLPKEQAAQRVSRYRNVYEPRRINDSKADPAQIFTGNPEDSTTRPPPDPHIEAVLHDAPAQGAPAGAP